jgi:hypothetical protein
MPATAPLLRLASARLEYFYYTEQPSSKSEIFGVVIQPAQAYMAETVTRAIPGTVHLVDLDHSLHTRHAGNAGDIVLVPTPSNDPDDPLNWTPRRKLQATICSNLYVFHNLQKLVIK